MKKNQNLATVFIGIINSAIGAGGGLISVPLMKRKGLDQKRAQATTLCVILPLTVISATVYIIGGNVTIVQALRYIPFGFAGAVVGVKIMDKVKNKILKKFFALFMIYTGIRILFG